MNIKILDSWLREYLKTKATATEIAEKLSLTSVSIERIEKYKNDLLYDIEITTNRPDLMSVVGLAREAGAVLPYQGIEAEFVKPKTSVPKKTFQKDIVLEIVNDPKLVRRVCAVVMDVKLKKSSQLIQDRLESTGIRSLNNLIDITNYVMRTIGHPTHVFDYDRLKTKKLVVRESRKGEKITTLDEKTYTLPGGDIVADNGLGEIEDLLGVMGTANSIVTDDTKRILLFVDNNEPTRIRKTSMSLAIRTEAAQINEKSPDPEAAMDALLYGIKLFEELADGQVVSEIIDIYPQKQKKATITVSEKKINSVIGMDIPLKKSVGILKDLGFETKIADDKITATPPSYRAQEIHIPEDLIEEIARVAGYHNIPNLLPGATSVEHAKPAFDEFYWERRIKNALKYWGFSEVYTYSMVSEDMYECEPAKQVRIQNPLNSDFVYMRHMLSPSLLQVVEENKAREKIAAFEIANIYKRNENSLPSQHLHLCVMVKDQDISFFRAKGLIEQLAMDCGIEELNFMPAGIKGGKDTIEIYLGKLFLGVVFIYSSRLIGFELDLELFIKHASNKKSYVPLSKYPEIVEDLALVAPATVSTGSLIEAIKAQSNLIRDVSLFDKYGDTRTFHVVYQSMERNLSSEDVGKIREKILKVLNEKHGARLKN